MFSSISNLDIILILFFTHNFGTYLLYGFNTHWRIGFGWHALRNTKIWRTILNNFDILDVLHIHKHSLWHETLHLLLTSAAALLTTTSSSCLRRRSAQAQQLGDGDVGGSEWASINICLAWKIGVRVVCKFGITNYKLLIVTGS